MFLFTLKLFTKLKSITQSFKPDLIIASSTYPLDNIPAYFLAKKNNALYCYEVHDLWPLSPMELGGYSKYHPFILAMQWAENFAYKNADFVVSMLPKTLEHMVSHGLKKEKFCYIPNGIVIDEWQSHPIPEAHAKLVAELRAKNKVIVGYAGGHSISNALNNLLEAAVIAVKEAPNLAFILVGDGVEKEKLIYESQRLSLRNIHFMPSIPKRNVPELLSSMDILYLGWHNNPLYRFGISPNKLIDYMMAGKPVVHAVNAGNDMVQEAGCGISVEPENPKAALDACIKISQMSTTDQIEMGARGKAFIIKNNNYEILAQKFIDCAISRK
jgi:glycosyltransferase involved in cell wall biosynthesis